MKQKGLAAYDERYRLVFEAGGLHWNSPEPNEYLKKALDTLPGHSKCIEFGCGEGYQAYFMASQGHRVTGIDLAPTAIEKARRETPAGLDIRFLVGDITEPDTLDLEPESFDLGVNIGSLHMMAEEEDRASHFTLIRKVLRPRGLFFMQNGMDVSDAEPKTDADIKEMEYIKSFNGKPPGYLSPRKVMTKDGEKKVMIPLCPKCKMLPLKGYVNEFEQHGFTVVSAEKKGGANCAFEAVILGSKI